MLDSEPPALSQLVGPVFLVILRDRSERTIKQLKIQLPTVKDPGFYRQVTSFNAFRDREHARSQSSRVVFRCSITDWEWALVELKIVKPGYITVKTVWDLYRAIGYDYKKQEYV